MGKRFKIALAGMTVALVGVIAWQAMPPREPVYKGKTLTWWLGTANPYDPDDPGQVEVNEAIRQAGVRSIPTLLELLHGDARDHERIYRIKEWLHKMGVIHTDLLAKDEWTRWQAAYAFKILGTNGQSAVPSLIEILRVSNEDYWKARWGSDARIWRSLEALGGVGPPAKSAIPMLLTFVNDVDVRFRTSSREAFLKIDPEAAYKAGITNAP